MFSGESVQPTAPRLCASCCSSRAPTITLATVGRVSSQAAAGHGVEDPFARGGRNHARRIAGEQDVASVVPARQRAQWNGRAFAPDGLETVEAGRVAQGADGVTQ